MQVRLDRAFGNAALFDCFQDISVKHIATEESDHMALLIELEDESKEKRNSRIG